MAKLSKGVRESMAKALVRHRFQSRAEELMAESVALFHAVRAERYDAETEKLLARLAKKHPKGVGDNDSTSLRARGMYISVGATALGNYGIATWTPKCESLPCLREDREQVSEALGERVADFALATKAFADELKTAYSRALGTLGQFGTAKRLSEEWPEAMPVIGNLIPTEDRSLPVVQLEAINDEFGLPPAVAA